MWTASFSASQPPVDLAYWYENAKPGPKQSCTSGSFPGGFDNDSTLNRSRGTAYIAPPGSSYDCKVVDGSGQTIGRIAWTGSPKKLYIEGTVFIDGKIEVQGNQFIEYVGRGTIYASDEIKIQNYAQVCGGSTCADSWNPEQNLLVLVGGATSDSGFLIENNTKLQAAVYVVNDYLQKNDATVWGPVIAQELVIENNAVNKPSSFTTLAPGQPGTTSTTTALVEVQGSYQG